MKTGTFAPKYPRMSGFTIIETLVAIAIGSIAMAGVVAMIQQVALSQATQKFTYEANTFAQEVNSSLSATNACYNSFGSINPSSFGSGKVAFNGNIVNAAGTVLYQTGKTYGDNAVILNGMTLSNYVPSASNGGTMNLALLLNSPGKVLGGSWLTRTMNIQVTTNAGGTIVSCVSLANATDGLWKIVPNTNQDIFYTAGKVGIGSAQPQYALDVTTDIAVSGLDVLRRDGSNAYLFPFGSGYSNNNVYVGGGGSANLLVPAGNFAVSGTLGVGTMTPSYQMDVVSSAVVALRLNGSNGAGTNNTQLRFAGGQNGEMWAIGTDVYAGNGGRDFTFYGLPGAGNVGPVLNIKADNGYVGMGMTNPAFQLDVSGDIAISGTDIARRDGSNAYLFPWGSGYGGSNIYLGGGAAANLILPSGNLTVAGYTSANGGLSTSSLTVNGGSSFNGGSTFNGPTAFNGNMTENSGTFTTTSLNVNGNESINGGTLTMNSANIMSNSGSIMVPGGSISSGYANGAGAGVIAASRSVIIGESNLSYGYPIEINGAGAGGGQAMIWLNDKNVQMGFNIAATGGGSAVGQIGTISGHDFQIYTGNTAHMAVHGNGNTEIFQDLHVDGTMYGAVASHSDRRLKRDILPLENTVEKLSKIDGVSFFWKDPKTDAHKQLGVIAQNVESVYPELIRTDDKGIKSVLYTGLIGPLIEAVKQLVARITGVDERVKVLEARLKAAEDQLRAINQKLGFSPTK